MPDDTVQPSKPLVPDGIGALHRCQSCGRAASLRWRYDVDGELEVICHLCYHIHRGKLAIKMWGWFAQYDLTPQWD